MSLLVALSLLAILQPTPTVPQKTPEKSVAPIQTMQRPAAENKEHVVVDKLPDKDRWDKTYIFLTGALALIGTLTLIAIWYQAVQTQRATKAMERSTGITVEIERGRIITFCDLLPVFGPVIS